MIAIKVENLTKKYKLYKKPQDRLKESLSPFKKVYHKDFYALSRVSFEIKKGETVGIIGRNGSGKSTLLKIITGVLTPTTGNVNSLGKISAILELGAGFNPEMSGVENIYLNASINGVSKEDIDSVIDEIISFSELEEFIHQPFKSYSSGMKARLSFAVAINIKPDILIVDEALAVGDAAFQRKCFAKMEQIREAGSTILFVSHSIHSIVALCSRAIWLSGGKKVIEGDPKLVTGLYMKNSSSNHVDSAKIQKELKEIQKALSGKKKEESQDIDTSIDEFFNPSLKPKSTIYYEQRGAKIYDVKITTLDGRVVNTITHGKNYIYTYLVEFAKEYDEIEFAMLIKSKDGDRIVGTVYKDSKGSFDIIKGCYRVSFEFKNLLNKGTYFLNAGILVRDGDKHEYAHRIIDVGMFEVLGSKEYAAGSVDLIENIVLKRVQ